MGFKGVKEEPCWKVLMVTDRQTDTQTFTEVRVKCYFQGSEDKMAMQEYSPHVLEPAAVVVVTTN